MREKSLRRAGLGALAIAVTLTAGCGRGIPVVGLDEAGNDVEERLPARIYSAKLGEVLAGTENSVVPALHDRDGGTEWELRTAVIAIGAKGEIGVGPMKIGVSPRFSLGFTRGANPPIP